MFKKFFGKKNDGFFIQLQDEDAKSTPAAKAPAKSAPASPPASPPAPTAAVTSASAPAAVVPTGKGETKTAKTEKKSVKTEKSEKKTETPKKIEAAPVATAPAPAITNFATDYLIKPSSNSGRRRPGANMRQFMDLARQIDKPKPFKATAAERKPAEKPVEKAVEKPVEKAAEKKSKEPISK